MSILTQPQYTLCPNCNKTTLTTFQVKQPHDKEFHDEFICIDRFCKYATYYMGDSQTIQKNQVTNQVAIEAMRQINSDRLLEKGQKLIEAKKEQEAKTIELQQIIGKSSIEPILEIKPFTIEKPIQGIQEQQAYEIVLKLDAIYGYDDIKELLRTYINIRNAKMVHVLLAGYPGTSKTIFLMETQQELNNQGLNCIYRDCTTTTKAGIIDYIAKEFSKRPIDILCLDEIDKMESRDQYALLNMLATQVLQKTTSRTQFDLRTSHMMVFATANQIKLLVPPIFDRFTSLYIPKYTYEQFMFIGTKVLNIKYKQDETSAKGITQLIWDNDASMRRIDDIGIVLHKSPQFKKASSSEKIKKIDLMIKTLQKRQIPNELKQ